METCSPQVPINKSDNNKKRQRRYRPRVNKSKVTEKKKEELKSKKSKEEEEKEDEEEDICFICTEPIDYYAVAPCDHRTCHMCTLRLRALYQTKNCAYCKVKTKCVNCFY